MARFQETVNIQPVSTETGAAGGALSLSAKLESFKNQQIVQAERAAAGRGATSAAGVELQKVGGITQAPKFKKDLFIGSIETRAHNKALRSAYLASINTDIRAEVGRIKNENPDDLIAFNEAVSGFAKGMAATVDPSIRQTTQNLLEDRITTAQLAVQGADIKRQNDIAFQELEEGAEATLNSALLSARAGDIEGSANELLDLFATYDAQEEAGFITEPQSRELKRTAELEATKESVIGTIRSMTENGDFIGALKGLEKAREEIPRGMSIGEHGEMIAGMTADINESLTLRSKIEDAEDDAAVELQESEYNDLAIGVTTGRTNLQDIIRAFKNKKIEDTHYNSLINTLNNRGFGLDDWPLINSIQEDIRAGKSPDLIRTEIINNSGSRLTENTANELRGSLNQALDRESPLNTAEAVRVEEYITQNARVVGPFGALDTESEKRLAAMRREFSTRVLAGEDLWTVADELVGKDAFNRAKPPQFGTKDDLTKSRELLDNALLTGQINDEDYNFESTLLDKLETLSSNIKMFEKDKKESLNAR